MLWALLAWGRGPDPAADEAQAEVRWTHNSSVREPSMSPSTKAPWTESAKCPRRNSSQPCLACTRGIIDTCESRERNQLRAKVGSARPNCAEHSGIAAHA